jgi:uncharacterized membrane protein
VDAVAIGVVGIALAWSALFGWSAVVRHLAGGSHAEDLGFTDQVIWNFLPPRGQWFRMSLYDGAFWNTELDLSQVARPDSLLAFHVEPMLLAFVPLYALGAGPIVLLAVQAIAFGLGAIPAYRLGGARWTGLALAIAYLLSPLGQSALLSDFHTTAIAAPLLLLAAERLLIARNPVQGVVCGCLALTAREDVAPAVVLLSVSLLLLGAPRKPTLALLALALAWGVGSLLVLARYSGGISPFADRFSLDALTSLGRPLVMQAGLTALLSGGWLALLSPLALLGALPTLVSNALSTSPWMAAFKAHYGVLLVPFIVLSCAVALRRLRPRLQLLATIGLLMTSVLAYVAEGSGPLGANYAPATVGPHAEKAAELASTIPIDAAVSATSTLVPRLSRRAHVYLFPTVLDADYVFLDVRGTSAPTSPGDVFLRVRDMLREGGWRISAWSDGLVLLQRDDAAEAIDIDPPSGTGATALAQPRLLDAVLAPSPSGAVDVDGPRWILRTTWLVQDPLPAGTRLEFWVDYRSGERVHRWDIADLWWNPPERWTPGQPVSIDVPDVPVRRFAGWQSAFRTEP